MLAGVLVRSWLRRISFGRRARSKRGAAGGEATPPGSPPVALSRGARTADVYKRFDAIGGRGAFRNRLRLSTQRGDRESRHHRAHPRVATPADRKPIAAKEACWVR